VAPNANCNRFDEGSNNFEIAQKLIASYDDVYYRLNRRNGKINFSAFKEMQYARRIEGTFRQLRLFFELYERITKDFGVDEKQWKQRRKFLEDAQKELGTDIGKSRVAFNKWMKDENPQGKFTKRTLDSAWDTNAFLANTYKAMLLSGQFFIRVIRTPDRHCIIQMHETEILNEGTPEQKTVLKRDDNGFKIISPNSPIIQPLTRMPGGPLVRCSQKIDELPEQYNLVGAVGRLFNSLKDTDSNNSYVDQIDVRGYYVNKLLATYMLFTRKLGSQLFDKPGKDSNYYDQPDSKALIDKLMLDMVSDKVDFEISYIVIPPDPSKEITIVKRDNEFNLFSSHIINTPFDSKVSKMFEMSKDDSGEYTESLYTKLMFKYFHQFAFTPTDRRSSKIAKNMVEVFKTINFGDDVKKYQTYNGGDTDQYFALKQNVISRSLMDNLNVHTIMAAIPRAMGIEIYLNLDIPVDYVFKIPEGADEFLAAAYGMTSQDIAVYANANEDQRKSLPTHAILSKVDPEKFQQIFDDLGVKERAAKLQRNPDGSILLPENTPAVVVTAYKIDKGLILGFLQGRLAGPDISRAILETLPVK